MSNKDYVINFTKHSSGVLNEQAILFADAYKDLTLDAFVSTFSKMLKRSAYQLIDAKVKSNLGTEKWGYYLVKEMFTELLEKDLIKEDDESELSYYPFPRDTNLHDYIHKNFVKPETVEYKYLPLHKRYKATYADIHYIYNLILLGNEYEDVLVIPEYQRGLVWSLEQKQNLILSILYGNPIGDFLFKKRKLRDSTESNFSDLKLEWTIIDGQQRLNAIKEFVGGLLPLPDGNYFKDIGHWSAREFILNYKITALTVMDISYEEELNIYYNRNFGGTAHTKEDLEAFLEAKKNKNQSEEK